MMKKKNVYYEAYFTVEASYIMPTAVMILLFILYWGFFCYDKSVSIQCSYLAALRASNEWESTTKELEQKTEEWLEELAEETFLYTSPKELYADIGLTSIKAGVSGKWNVLFSELGGIPNMQWTLDSMKSASRLKPSSYIRKYHLVKR